MNEQLGNVFRGMTVAGKAAVGVAVLALVVAVWSTAGVLGALIRPALDTVAVAPPGPELATRFAAALDADRSFIDDKSIFFTPKAPVVERPVVDPKKPVETRYTGPKLMGLSGHFAYFDRAVLKGAQEIKIGERGGTVELIRIVPPFTAVVKYEGQEWTLDLLKTQAVYAAAVPLGAGSTGRFGTANNASSNPFTRRGSSPNSNDLFGETRAQGGAASEGASPRRPPRGGPSEN